MVDDVIISMGSKEVHTHVQKQTTLTTILGTNLWLLLTFFNDCALQILVKQMKVRTDG